MIKGKLFLGCWISVWTARIHPFIYPSFVHRHKGVVHLHSLTMYKLHTSLLALFLSPWIKINLSDIYLDS